MGERKEEEEEEKGEEEGEQEGKRWPSNERFHSGRNTALVGGFRSR